MKTTYGILAVSLLLSGCEKYSLDQKVKELCAKDGGTKVYQTVKLARDKFNEWGQPNFYQPVQEENALGPDYIFRSNVQYYKRGNPQMARYHFQVIRRSDEAVLGESVSYSRSGGDLPGPWHESSYHCPEEYGDIPLLTKIFVQSGKE